MIGFDFDRTIEFLDRQGFLFPKEGVIISGRKWQERDLTQKQMAERGMSNYELLIDPANKFGISRDQKSIWKSRAIITRKIDEYYEDDVYQLRIIFNYLRMKKYECKLMQVYPTKIEEFILGRKQ